MTNNLTFILAAFTAPETIGVTPQSLLWIFPLLASVAIIYKAIKTRVIFLQGFFKEVLILFGTISVVMIAAAITLNVLVWLLTT